VGIYHVRKGDGKPQNGRELSSALV
jgi:hypothetical protein